MGHLLDEATSEAEALRGQGPFAEAEARAQVLFRYNVAWVLRLPCNPRIIHVNTRKSDQLARLAVNAKQTAVKLHLLPSELDQGSDH